MWISIRANIGGCGIGKKVDLVICGSIKGKGVRSSKKMGKSF